MRTVTIMASVMVALAACSGGTIDSPSSPEGIAAGTLRVVAAKATYTRTELKEGIRGSITNTSDQILYARLGDAFNSAREQDPVYIAIGSDGAIERSEGTNWRAVEGAILIEGVKEIELRPGKTYTFIAPISENTPAGTYRVNLGFRATSGAEQASGRTLSETFEIR